MKLFRANTWWNAVLPQVLGWVYFSWLLQLRGGFHFSISDVAAKLMLFFIALVSISAFGYLLNDWCDIETDKLSKKKNELQYFTPLQRACFVFCFLALGCIAWCFIPENTVAASALFVMQVLLLVCYSVPPVRMKNKGFWGVGCDALYGHVVPVFITLFAFASTEYLKVAKWSAVFLLTLLVVTLLKGMRNILLHQMEDRKRDALVGIHTFGVEKGGLFLLNFINKILVIEVLSLIVFVFVLGYRFPPFVLPLFFFTIVSYFAFSGWKIPYLPQRQIKFKFLYFMNDFYEGWMPVTFLLILSVMNTSFFLLMVLHLVLFPKFIVYIFESLRAIHQNFKTEENY